MVLQIENYNYNGHSSKELKSSVLFMNPPWIWFNEEIADAKSERLPYINKAREYPQLILPQNPLKYIRNNGQKIWQ